MKNVFTRLLKSRIKGIITQYIMDVKACHATITSNGNNTYCINKDNTIKGVSFEGGPSIVLGDDFNGRKVVNIEKAIVLTLE